MSIINDALKKAQHQFSKNNSQEKAQPMPDPNPPVNPQPMNPQPTSQNPIAKPAPPQPAPMPDMSQYIPVREKTKPAEPKILSEEISPPRPQDLRKQDGSESRKPSVTKIFLTFVTFILLGCGIFLAFYLYKIESIPDARSRANAKKNMVKDIPKQINKVVESIPLPEQVKQTISPSTKPAKKETVQQGIVLNGIMLMGEKRVALINNKIYEVGDSIDGKEILSISPEMVKIKDGENIKTLKVQ